MPASSSFSSFPPMSRRKGGDSCESEQVPLLGPVAETDDGNPGMFKSSALSAGTAAQDGVNKRALAAREPTPFGAHERDASTDGCSEISADVAASATITSGVAPLLRKTGPAPGSDDVSSHGGVNEHYPEGGFRAWQVVLGCWLTLFASLGFMNILATFQAYLTTNQPLHVGPGVIGGMIFCYTSLSFLLGIYVGPVFDKYGPRWLILSGTVCLAASLLLASIGAEYRFVLAALAVLSSLGSSLLFIPSIATIGHFFDERRGLATGVAMTASSASGVVFPFILQALFVRVGWAWAVRALALVCLVIGAAANFLIRSRFAVALNASPHPHAQIFRTPVFTPTVAAVFFAQFASFLALSYMSSYVLSKGFGHAFSFNVIAILNASSVVGRIAVGWAADWIGPFNASVISSTVAALACFVIWLPAGGTGPGLVIFAVLFGCASGGMVSLAPVSVGRLCKTREYGQYYGACYTIASLGSLFAIPVAERVVRGNRGLYWGLVVVTGVLYLAAAVAFTFARVSVVGRRIWVAF